ncbi:MAG: PKD domain-containing protein [Crocinitomicaceae bacterium]|nr:PKD domain-containing protein [Crocinitomicaceae bacterium]
MRSYYYKYCIFALIVLFSQNLIAQIDTLFWFAAPEVSSSTGESPIKLRLMTYDDPSTIELSLPANSGFTPISITIPANSVDSIDLTPFLSSIESPAANIVSNNGIKITATEPISAFYQLNSSGNKEIFSLKGNKGLGDNFYTPFQTFWNNANTTPSSFSSIDIVASENNTTVLITPRTAITGHIQNATFSILLNEGETYSARDMAVSGSTTLAGSIISSNQPISVTLFSGALSNGSCDNAMGDQITTEEYAGTDFVIKKGTSSTDRVYILATQNGTSITVENSTTTSTLINWGETYEIAISDLNNYINTSKPVYVWHASGYGCMLSGAQVPPLLCAGTYSTAFTRTSSDSLGLILYTRTGFESQFAINGNTSLISPTAFSNVPGTSGAFKMAVIYFNTTDIPINSYNKVTNAGDVFGLGITHGSGGNGSAYGYLSEFTSYPFTTAGNNNTICANSSLPINGLIGGGTVTGNWTTSGFGSFASASDILNNTYVPSPLDSLISPIELILTSTGPCPIKRDTISLTVTPAPIVSASADQIVCENNAVVQLAGSVAGGTTTGNWTTLGSGTFTASTDLTTDYIPSPADITAGTVQLILTSTGAATCADESDTMNIQITSAAVVDAGVDTIFVCENNPITSLSGSVTGLTTTGKWITTGGGLFLPNNISLNADYQPSLSDINSGNVTLYLESTSNGNCSVVTDSIVISFTAPPIVTVGTNILTCANNAQVQLSGAISGATTTGVWTGGTGTFSPSSTDLTSSYTPTAGEINAGTLFLTLTSTNNGGCIAESNILQVEFIDPPFANFNFTEECLYDGSIFTDFSIPGYDAITSWEWDFGDLSTSTDQNENHFYASPGTYDVQLIVESGLGCIDTITNAVQVFEVPVADFTYSANCPNNQIIVDFTDNSTTVSDPINYWLYDFGGQGSSASEDPTQLFSADGDYTITHIVGTTNGCFDTTTQILSVPAYPVAGFSYNTNNGLNIGAIFNFINTSQNATSYIWDFGNLNTSIEENPSNTYFVNGSYVVTQHAYGDLGCVDSISQIIEINTVTDEITRLIPNAISPNGDGKNDVWKLEFINLLYPNAQVDIFNQWGQNIYSSIGYNVPWDGIYNDELVSDGTYYYVIQLNGGGNLEDELFKGTVLVLKSKK